MSLPQMEYSPDWHKKLTHEAGSPAGHAMLNQMPAQLGRYVMRLLQRLQENWLHSWPIPRSWRSQSNSWRTASSIRKLRAHSLLRSWRLNKSICVHS